MQNNLLRAGPESLSPESTRVLHSVVQITGERNFDDIRISLIRTIFEMLPASHLVVYKISPQGAQARLTEVARAERAQDAPICAVSVTGLGPRGLVPDALQSQSIVRKAPQSESLPDGTRECVPICAKGRVLELIETRFVAATGNNSVILEALLRLYGNILDLVHDKEIDALTGLLNRRAFDIQLDGLLRRQGGGESQAHWWLVLVDADHFKAVNDTYGHLVGDEVLLLLAQLMNQEVRITDQVFRYGGEEFAILLSPSTREEAHQTMERVRLAIAQRRFPQVGHMTISGGMVAIDRYDHASSVIGRADRALYQAKNSGRDQILDFADLSAAGLVAPDRHGNEIELF